MKFVLWLEILTMIGYYGLMAIGLNQAIMGHWGFVLISVMTLAGITLAGFAPIPGRWGEIPATLVLIRRLVWKVSSQKFKELYFIRFVVHCVAGDYRKFILTVLEKHNVHDGILVAALIEHYQGRMHFIHAQWMDITKKTFITYGDVGRVQVSKVQHEFDKKSVDGMIAHFKQGLEDGNLNLIIENHLFYNFINNKTEEKEEQ